MPESDNGSNNQHQHKQKPTDDSNNSNSNRKRVMIINDRDDINFSIKTVLEEKQDSDLTPCNIKVYPFTDPYLALEHFRPGLYDLIFIDLVMPKMGGFEFYSKIKKLDSRLKVCFLTASDLPEEIRKQMFTDDGLEDAAEEGQGQGPEKQKEEKIFFINIPVSNQDLIKKVREILDLK
jgi:CheY-like chemotaxis protein